MDELTSFLKNTAKVLENHTVQELNTAVISFLKSKNKNENLAGVDEILDIVCTHFGISKRTLIKSTARGKVTIARKISYILLTTELALSPRFIAKRIFFKWPNSVEIVMIYYKKLDVAVKSDREFLETLELLKKEIKCK